MTDIVTREEREELRRLYAAATPGKWELEACMKHPGYGWHLREDNAGGLMLVGDDLGADGALTVAVHNTLPRLLDTIDALEERVSFYRATLVTVMNLGDRVAVQEEGE